MLPILSLNLTTKELFYMQAAPSLDIKKEDVIGKNFCDWTATEYHSTMKQSLEDVFSKAISQTYQSRALGINHEIRWFLSRLSPVVIDDEVKNAVLILSDITDRIKAEEALKESEENYRVITQSTIDAIFSYRQIWQTTVFQ